LFLAAARAPKGPQPFAADFIAGASPDISRLEGFGAVENTPRGPFRWGYGPGAVITFFLASPEQEREMLLSYKIVSPIQGQDVDILVNGKVIGRLDQLPGAGSWDKWYGGVLSFFPKAGSNAVEFRVSKWNGHGAQFAPDDQRPLSLMFNHLSIFPK
jgi:hypothetical protein